MRRTEPLSKIALELLRAKRERLCEQRAVSRERRISRRTAEREQAKLERIQRRAEIDRLGMFNNAAANTAGPKRQGKLREIIPTTDGRIEFEREQRRAMSYSQLQRSRIAEREAVKFAKNWKVKLNTNN